MKKIIILFLALLLYGSVYGQDVDTTVTSNYTDTLTATVDTIQVTFRGQYQYVILTAYTTTGTDTIFVETMDKGSLVWSKKALVDMSTTAPYSDAVITTTKTSFYVFDPKFRKIRLYTSDTSASTVVNIGG